MGAPRPESESERQLGDLLALALAGAILLPAPLLNAGPTICPFRRLTGRPCPACGITRSWNAVAALDLPASVRVHPLGPLTFAAALAIVGGSDRVSARSRSRPVLAVLGGLWVLAWLARLRSTPRP